MSVIHYNLLNNYMFLNLNLNRLISKMKKSKANQTIHLIGFAFFIQKQEKNIKEICNEDGYT